MYANVLFVSTPELVLIHRTIIKNLGLKLYFPLPHPVPQFPMGFSVAASVRVGNALGAGNTEQAKLSSKVALICAGMTKSCPRFAHLNVPPTGILLSPLFSLSLVHLKYTLFLMPNPAIASCFTGACLGVSKDVIGYIFTTEM